MVEEWKENARLEQQFMYEMTGDRLWDKVNPTDLMKKILCFMYGSDKIDILNDRNNYGISQDQYDRAKKINDKINKYYKVSTPEYVYLGYVFINIKMKNDKGEEGIYKVLRIPKDNKALYEHFIFIELLTLRIYDGWDDFMKTNKLPPCYMCYPKRGIYSHYEGTVMVSISESSSCKKIYKFIDAGAGISNLTASAVCVSSLFFPVAAPFVVGSLLTCGATSAYTVGRSTYKLNDIYKHGGSVSLNNTEALENWISIVFDIASFATLGGAKATKILSSASSKVDILLKCTKILSRVTITLRTATVVVCVTTLIIKFVKGELTPDDCIPFISLCFFFSNIIVTVNDVEKLISRFATNNFIINFFNTVKNEGFSCVKSPIVHKDMEMVVTLICGISSLYNNRERIKSRFIHVYNECKIYLLQQSHFLTLWTDLVNNVKGISQELEDHFKPIMEKIEKMFSVSYWRNLIFNGKKVFRTSSPLMLEFMSMCVDDVLRNVTNNESNKRQLLDRLASIIKHFAIKLDCKTDCEIIYVTKYICSAVRRKFDGNIIRLQETSPPADINRAEQLNTAFWELTLDETRLLNEYLLNKPSMVQNSLEQNPLATIEDTQIFHLDYDKIDSMPESYFYDTANKLITSSTFPNKDSLLYQGSDTSLLLHKVQDSERFDLLLFYHPVEDNRRIGWIALII